MRYIIKDNKVYGIYNQNYSSLAGKPLINNHELAEGISYSSEDLGIVVGPISQKEYDNMLTHNPQTIYVVYDDIIDPSSTTINYNDLDNKPQISGQTLTGNKSLSSLNIYSKEEVRNLIAAGRSILVVATKPASPTPNTLYYVETTTPAVYHVYLYDSNTQEADLGLSTIDLSDYYTKTQSDNKFEILTNKVNSVNFTSPSTTQYLSEKGIVDNFAPITIQRSVKTPDGGISLNSDDCRWNMKNSGLGSNYRISEEKMFANAYLVDPIGGKWIWGTLKVLQTFSTTAGVGLLIHQEMIASYFNDVPAIDKVVFRRIGQVSSLSNPGEIESATITWKVWYPVEYPSVSMPLDSTSVSNYGLAAWGSNANITGGILKVTYNGLMCTSVATNMAITSLTKFSLKQSYAIGHLSGIDNNKNCYMWGGNPNLLANKMEANIRYYGQIMIPLGY